ncbi:hypothetical protein ABKN59_008824 [Abortiporus biennis]
MAEKNPLSPSAYIRSLTCLINEAFSPDPNLLQVLPKQVSLATEHMSHFATMVNISQCPEHLNVAVTGNITPHGLEAIVLRVVSGGGDQDTGKGAHSNSTGSEDLGDSIRSSFEFDCSIQESSITPEQVINPQIGESPSLIEHLQDLLRVLQLATTTNATTGNSDGESLKPKINSKHITIWLLNRCIPKLHQLFLTIPYHWDIRTPIQTMKNWQPEETEEIPFKSYTVRLTDDHMTGILRKYSELPVEEHAKIFELNNATMVAAWIKCIASLVSAVDELLIRDFYRDHNNGDTGKDSNLSIKGLEKIFTSTSLTDHFCPKGPWNIRVRQDTQAAVAGEDGEYDEEETASLHLNFYENHGAHVFRYLCKLVAWNTAVPMLLHLVKKTATLPRISIVTLTITNPSQTDDCHSADSPPSHSDDDSEVIQPKSEMERSLETICQELEDRLDTLGWEGLDQSKWWLRQKKTYLLRTYEHEHKSSSSYVHAEAALMVLAKYITENQDLDDVVPDEIRSVLEMRLLPIGTTRKCCYMCHRLAKLLFNVNVNKNSEPLYVSDKFCLNKTYYGRLSRWDPGPLTKVNVQNVQGVEIDVIPVDILNELVVELKKILFEMALSHRQILYTDLDLG